MQRPLIKRMIDASSISDLEALGRQHALSKMAQMLYALRFYQLDEGSGRSAVMRSLPTSAEEMEAFDEFTHGTDKPYLAPLYRMYYSAVFKSVTRMPEFLPAIFSISVTFNDKDMTDYDDVDWFCKELGNIHNSIPREFDSALSDLTVFNRKYVTSCSRER